MSFDGHTSAGRTAFLIHSLEFGGAQRSVIATLKAWPSNATACMLISARGGALLDEAEPINDVHLLAPRWPQARGIGQFVLALRRLVRLGGMSTILTNSFGMSRVTLLARFLGLLRGVDVIVVEHSNLSAKVNGLYQQHFSRVLMLAMTRFLYRRADAIVGVSDGVSRDLEVTLGLPAGSVVTIYNPVDAERITEATVEAVPSELSGPFEALRRPVVITTGRLVTAKAHSDLLDAFALLPESRRGSLVILGEGPLRGGLEQQAERLGIADRVWMPGFVDNPWWFMARSDVFALSSHWEGHPLVLLEALACGNRVASTDCPSGARETLAGVPSTRLTPVGDPTALARAVDELLDAPPQATPHTHLDRYRPSEVAARYADVARDVHDRHERTTPR